MVGDAYPAKTLGQSIVQSACYSTTDSTSKTSQEIPRRRPVRSSQEASGRRERPSTITAQVAAPEDPQALSES